MSSVTFARKDSTASAGSRTAHPSAPATGLRIGEPDDSYEREADRAADEMLAPGKLTRHWSFSHIGIGAPLQRKCGCGGSGGGETDECDDCKMKKLLQRKPSAGQAPEVAPPIVHSVLSSTGRSLDRGTRAFFEPRFGVDLGSVRVHDDSRAARSAEAVNAHAYTAGRSIVFGAGRYRPDSVDGRRLLAHELTHVVQQRGPAHRLVQRQPEDDAEVVDHPKTGSLIERAFDAADAAHWEQAAELANGLNASDLRAFIASLGAGWKVEQLHAGALGNPRVGANSQIARATRSAYLNAKFAEQMKGGFYEAAAEYLNGFSPAEIRSRVGKMKTDVVAGLHNGAVAKIGAGSNAATITGEELERRKEKGDAAAEEATKAVVAESPPQKKKRCQDTDGKGFKIFPLRLPKGMWQLSNAPIGAERKGDEILVKQPFNEVKGDPMFRGETKTLPLDTFLGGIRLQKDEIVGVRLYDDNKRLVCVSGEDMLKFNDATEMALWFSVGRTALDAATVFAPGASAGIGKATAFGVGNIVVGQAMEVGRQEMEVHYGLREEVDWGGIAFDTVFQLATLGFSKYLNNAATKAVLGKAPELGQKPIQLAIQAAVQGGTGLVHAAARTAFDLLRKQKKKFVMEEFLEQLAMEFATGALFAFIAGAAHHDEGLPGKKQAAPDEHDTGAPAPAVHDEIPQPQPQKKAATAKADEHATPGQPKRDKAATPSVEEVTAVDKKDALAQEKTKDGHDVIVTGKGVGKCSPPPCPVIHIEYAEELKDRPRLQDAYDEIERLRAVGTKAAAAKAARHSKQLVDVLEGIRAENKLTPGRKNVAPTGHPDDVAEPVMDTSELLDQHGVQEGKPVDIRLQEAQAGNRFDDKAGKKYGASEVPIEDKGGRRRRLDSYDAAKGEIVSRKSLVTANGQIASIDEFKMIEFFQEFALKYPDGATIANTPSTRRTIMNGAPLAGQKLKGQYVLEVPPQEMPIPARIKDEAAKRGIIIRDDKGKVY